MKALVAAACIAVISAVGYYFWGEYRSYATADAQARTAATEQRRIECTELLSAYKNGGAAGLRSAAEAQNKSQQCADFMNDLYGFSGENFIFVDENGVYMGPLD